MWMEKRADRIMYSPHSSSPTHRLQSHIQRLLTIWTGSKEQQARAHNTDMVEEKRLCMLELPCVHKRETDHTHTQCVRDMHRFSMSHTHTHTQQKQRNPYRAPAPSHVIASFAYHEGKELLFVTRVMSWFRVRTGYGVRGRVEALARGRCSCIIFKGGN